MTIPANITCLLTRQAANEWMNDAQKSIDYLASCVGVDTTTLRYWLHNPNVNGIDHLVTAFIETNDPKQFRPTATSMRKPTDREDTHKFCQKCGFTLPVAQFQSNTARADGRQAWCRVCTNEYERNRRSAVQS